MLKQDGQSVKGGGDTNNFSETPASVQKKLQGLTKNGKSVRPDALKPEHLLSEDHIRKGILELGLSKTEIMEKVIEAVIATESKNKLAEGTTQIFTKLGSSPFEIRVYVSGSEISSINGFVGHSGRIFPNHIYL